MVDLSNKDGKGKHPKTKWRKIAMSSFLTLIAILLAISILSNNREFQNWYTEKLSDYLTSRTGHIVSMGISEANIIKGIVIKDLHVQDLHDNSLINVELISTSLRKNLFSLVFQNEINLEDIKIENGEISIKTYEGDGSSNLQIFLNSFGSGKEKESKCREFNIKTLELNNITLNQSNLGKSDLDLHFGHARVDFDKVDLCNKQIEVRKLMLESASFGVLVKQQSDKTEENNTIGAEESPKDTFRFLVRHLLIDDSAFNLSNPSKQSRFKGGINWNDLQLTNIELEARNVSFSSEYESSYNIEQLSFNEKSGFKLERMSVENGSTDSRRTLLENVLMQTRGSLISHDLQFDYNDYYAFLDFTKKVRMDIRLKNCDILASDIFYFANTLSNNDFFRENKGELIQVNGRITGRINNLKGKNINLVLEDKSYLSGNFSSRNLDQPGEALMNIRLEELSSTTSTISKLFPSINLTSSFNRLGRLQFKGSFDGYFHDFVAFGALQTDLGNMNMDMRLDLSKGTSLAEYSGNFTLNDFELGTLSDNQDIGKISLKTKIIDGSGLNINTVNAEVDAKVDYFEFKDHIYKNIVMDGYLDKNLFNGDFSIDEDLIKVDLSGIINYGDSIPIFNFTARIDELDLFKLNITKNPLRINSDLRINLKGNTFNNIEGKFTASNLTLSKGNQSILLDSVNMSSQMRGFNERYIDLSSEILSFYFDGVFQINQIPDAILDMLKKNHPQLMDLIPNIKSTVSHPDYYYDFYIYVPDSKALFEIIQPLPASVNEMVISGHVDHSLELIDIKSSVDSMQIGEVKLGSFVSEIELEKDRGYIHLDGEKLKVGDLDSDSVFLDARISADRVSYDIKIDTLDEKLKTINLSGITIPNPKGFETSIENGSIQLLDENWFFKNNNRIVIGKDYIDLENLSLINNLNSLSLEDINSNKGVKAVISGFELGLLNSFMKKDILQFSGKMEGFILLPSLFKERVYEGAIRVVELNVNDVSYGSFSSLLQLDPITKNRLNFSGSLKHPVHNIDFNGGYDLEQKIVNSQFDVQKFPVSFLEHIIAEGISGTEGYATGNVSFTGPLNALEIDGQAMVHNGKTKIDYLGTSYNIDKQNVSISTNLIDFSGAEIRDVDGNTGVVNGGIKHNRFMDLELDLNITSPKLIGLNTTQNENPLYYGKGIGSVNIRFSGPLESSDISLDAVVFQGSNLTIPVRRQTEVSQQSFIRFNQVGDKQNGELGLGRAELTGVNLDMNLSIRPGAKVKIILDENAGDNIQGQGSGDVRLEITRTGVFEMYGNYNIDEGTYLFTALTLIQKPFTIRKGGKISWNGDPLGAQIDLIADYQGERVSLDNFIKEYTINNPTLAQSARKRTDVELLLHLTGSLLHPNVSFDLNFPNLDGDVKSYVFSKLQKLRADQNLMYTQAVTLLSLGAFLPQGGLISSDNSVSTAATGLHTGLQYSAVMISKYMSGLFEELFSNSSWISGIDIDINVINSQVLELEQDNIWPNEYTYDAKLHLFDDKASFELSGSYVNRGIISDKSYANGDFIFKYYFTEDRRLRIEAYSKREFDELINEWKWKIGTGLNYQMEFGSIYDLKKDAESTAKQIQTSGSEK